MERATLVNLFDQTADNAKRIKGILHLLNGSCCKAILRILNNSPNITYKDMASVDNLEETETYRCLKKLRQLNFVNVAMKEERFEIRLPNMKRQYAYKRIGEQLFSLNKSELSKFIDLVNEYKISADKHGSMILEIECSNAVSAMHRLDYGTLKRIYETVKCLCSNTKRELLLKLLGADEPLADVQLTSANVNQSTIYRNLDQLSKYDLIKREPNKNFMDNSPKQMNIVAGITFLQSISYLKFNPRINLKTSAVGKLMEESPTLRD